MTIKSFWNSEYEQVTEFLQGRGGKITKTKQPNCPKRHTLKPLKIISNFELHTGEN